MKPVLITSALPYVNNIPHLGNLIQVLSADVYARYCRLRGYPTLYVCGSDEYGAATETRALLEGITPRELCDRYHKLHADVYKWFNVSFDSYGRTATPKHTEITQSIFKGLEAGGYIKEKTLEQTYCEKDGRFLADRYVRGTCPHCGYEEARGDQCENCGKLLDPVDLKDPRCGLCGATPVRRTTNHLYIDLPAILPKLQAWMDRAAIAGSWARNAVQMTQAWIRDGLQERAITRDLKWGIPVPRAGYENKVFYVWFDAPIGYISITANLTDRWEQWWRRPDEVKLVHFIGKDNIPFHTVIFPCSLLGSGQTWTMLASMSSTEYLNYESGKFSKSRGVGVFGTDAVESGIPADVWRFYLYYNRPERSDALFTWKDFQEKVNGELIGNLANLINRTLTFASRNFPEGFPAGAPSDAKFWETVRAAEAGIADSLERIELRDAFRQVFALSSIGNKRFQDEEPWKAIKENPPKAAGLIRDLVYLIRDLSVLAEPYIPATSAAINGWLGVARCDWASLGRLEGVGAVRPPALLFRRLEDEEIERFRARFAGTTQAQRAAASAAAEGSAAPAAAAPPAAQEAPPDPALRARFHQKVELTVARVTAVERHPKADTLFIESVDLGTEKRQIVSGLVGYYAPEELSGRNVVMVTNLKPARLRGVESQGMLLAAQDGTQVEVLFADWARPGNRVTLQGEAEPGARRSEIDIEEFSLVPIRVQDSRILVEGAALECAGRPLSTAKVKDGQVK
jgi:methionyl-tRNA synthetase